MEKETELNILRDIKNNLYADNWKSKSLNTIQQYKEIIEDENMLILLDKFIWFIDRNRFVEARRLAKREIENLEGTTEKICKIKNINSGYCKICKNINCNLNKNIDNQN